METGTARVVVHPSGIFAAESQTPERYLWLWNPHALGGGAYVSTAGLEEGIAALGVFTSRLYPVAVNSVGHVLLEGYTGSGLRQVTWQPGAATPLTLLPPLGWGLAPWSHTLDDLGGVAWLANSSQTNWRTMTYFWKPGQTSFTNPTVERVAGQVTGITGILTPQGVIAGSANRGVFNRKTACLWWPGDTASGTAPGDSWVPPPGSTRSALLAANGSGDLAGIMEAPSLRLVFRPEVGWIFSDPLP